jgi:hypothetical protein
VRLHLVVSLDSFRIGWWWPGVALSLVTATALAFLMMSLGSLLLRLRGRTWRLLVLRCHSAITSLGWMLDGLMRDVIVCHTATFGVPSPVGMARDGLVVRVIIVWFGVLEYDVPRV